MLSNMIEYANHLIASGFYAVKDTTSLNPSFTDNSSLRYEQPIVDYTTQEIKQLAKIFKTAEEDWQDYNDMEFEEKCFFFADYLIPETNEDSPLQLDLKLFTDYVTFAQEKGLLKKIYTEELIAKASYYCHEVLYTRDKWANYSAFKAIIRKARKEPNDEDHNALYNKIPLQYREQISREIDEERRIDISRTLLLTWFTFLQTGFFQTRIPSLNNKIVNPATINIPATLATLNQSLSFMTNTFSSFFSLIDHQITTLLFGFAMIASAEKIKSNPVYDIYPQFEQGAVGYPYQTRKEICQAYTQAQESMSSYLKDPGDNKRVIIVGESDHDKIIMGKLTLLNWLSHWLPTQETIQSISIVHEIAETTPGYINEFLTALDNNFVMIDRQHNQRQHLVSVYRRFCFNLAHLADMETGSLDVMAIFSCTAVLAKSHGFTVTPAKISPEPTTKAEQQQIKKYLQHYPESLHFLNLNDNEEYRVSPIYNNLDITIKTVDKIILDTTLKELEQNPSNLVVVFTGIMHAPEIAKRLEAKGHQTQSVTLATDKVNLIQNMTPILSKQCISSIDVCQSASAKNAKVKGATHCIEQSPYELKRCDAGLHKIFSFYNFRLEQSEKTRKITSSFFSPSKPSHLMVPKECIQEMSEEGNGPKLGHRDEL